MNQYQREFTFQDALTNGDIYQMAHILDTRGWSGCWVPIDACVQAASLGYDEVLYWLREQGCLWQPALIAEAARKAGHHHIVQRMLDQRDAVLVRKGDRLGEIEASMHNVAVIAL